MSRLILLEGFSLNRFQLFPITTTIEKNSLTIAGHNLAALAGEHGTPLYLYDRATMDSAVMNYQSAIASHYPMTGSVTYAGKAFLNLAIAQWTQSHKLFLDCTGEGETAIAIKAGVPREHILVHGVNKSEDDLKSAMKYAGTIVVDNLTELQRISTLFTPHDSQIPEIWLRLLPGIAVETHHSHTQTGQHDSKFGMTSTEIMEAAQICKLNNLPLTGIHFHQGSNFRDPVPLKAAIELGLDLSAEIGFTNEWHFSPGGGWGVAYHEDELPQPDPNVYVSVIAENVIEGFGTWPQFGCAGRCGCL
jgi:diaminopimelate decarboxylase